MSRFFAQGNETSSESESSDEEIKDNRPTFHYSSEDEEEKRIVRSTKEKRFDELTNIIKQIRNYKKIKDMSSMLTGFEELVRAYTKALTIIMEDGGHTPKFYLRCLVELEDFIAQVWDDKDSRNIMSKNNSKSLSILRQKMRKYNKNFQVEISKFRENLDDDEDVKDEGSDSGDEDLHIKKASVKATAAADDGVSDDSFESDSDSSDEGVQYGSIRERFLKRTTDKEEEKRSKEKKEKREKENIKKEEAEEAGEWETVTRGSSMTISKQILFDSKDAITVHSVLNKYKEVIGLRHQRRTEKLIRVELLRELLGVATQNNLGLGLHIKMKISEICMILEFSSSAIEAMKMDNWKNVLGLVQTLTTLLAQNAKAIIIGEFNEEGEEFVMAPFKINSSLASLTERIMEEFYKVLKQNDPFSSEYADKLKDEPTVVSIIDNALKFLECHNQTEELCRVKLCKIESHYYKIDRKLFESNPDKSVSEDFDKVCRFVYNHDTTQRLRTRAILAQVYHKALHDEWYEARDLMLMSNLQQCIHHADISTQILYNRTMAQLGLCAFRHGLIEDAHNCLADLMTTGCVRELLGQGFTNIRNVERTPEQEQRDRMNQLPFHLGIHIELLECTYLITAMLISIPVFAAQELDARRRLISKAYYQVLRSNQKLSLNGPPETMREFVVAASRSLKAAKWRDCVDYLFNPKMKLKVWSFVSQPTEFQETVVSEIKRQSLRSYIFAYAVPVYSSINLKMLSDMFELTETEVESVLSRMVMENEVEGSLQLHTKTFVLKRGVRKNSLQILSHQLTEKLATLIELGERCVERNFPLNRFQKFVRAGD